MKKLSVKFVVERFAREAAELQAYYLIQWNTFGGKSLELTVLAIVAEHSVLSLAVSWETFVNDYFVAAINRNPGTFKSRLRERMRDSVKDKYGNRASRYTQIALPKHPTAADVTALTAPNERNISFKDADSMVQRAAEWLAPEYARLFQSLTQEEKAFIDGLIGIRNYLAHVSIAASGDMDAALDRLSRARTHHDLGRTGRKVRNVGAFMRSWSLVYGLPRIVTYCDVARSIGLRLKPP